MKEFLDAIYPVPAEILDEYISHWSPYELPRKTIMTAPGETERYMYFVLEGIQKSYYLTDNKQHIIAFAYAPSFSGIPESFFTQTPSRYFLETITASRTDTALPTDITSTHRPTNRRKRTSPTTSVTSR